MNIPLPRFRLLAALAAVLAPAPGPAADPQPSGDLKQWHKVTLTLDGPTAAETDTSPNPFTDYRLTVTFRHESGSPSYIVPGYFAADGNAGETSATKGNKWRAHLSPDKPGTWTWAAAMAAGQGVATDPAAKGEPVPGVDGKTGTFAVGPTDKAAPDFRAAGRLEYVGKRYLRFAGTGDTFLRVGADSPETLLAYTDFDGTETKKIALKTWKPHAGDWKPGDPTWQGGKGKGLIGALNYLSAKGVNGISFLTYNAGGDGDNVWPFVSRNDKFHYDCSKLDQWGVVFDHAQARGLFLHFKLQEQENDDERVGDKLKTGERVGVALDGGRVGAERKLYLRELIARYGHHLALNWNLGEENTQSSDEQRQMAKYIVDTDPYPHPVVVHTFPPQQDKIYTPLLGAGSVLHGASLQNSWNVAHQRTLKWVGESAKAGRPWVVCNDEQGPAGLGVPPDKGYAGHDGVAVDKKEPDKKGYTADDIRKRTLWGTLTAGGAGVEYYFGYQLPPERLGVRRLPQPGEVVGVRPARPGVLPREQVARRRNDQRRRVGRQPDPLERAVLLRQAGRGVRGLPAGRRGVRPGPDRGIGRLRRVVVRPAERRRADAGGRGEGERRRGAVGRRPARGGGRRLGGAGPAGREVAPPAGDLVPS